MSASGADHGALVDLVLGLRPFASLADGAIAAGAGVRVAGGVLALPALAAAGLLWLRARRYG
jgi:hypothetical protein